jgi:hypothetical protein
MGERPGEGARRPDLATDGEDDNKRAWCQGGLTPLMEPTSTNILSSKPLHAMSTPMSKAAMKMERSKFDSYLSL